MKSGKVTEHGARTYMSIPAPTGATPGALGWEGRLPSASSQPVENTVVTDSRRSDNRFRKGHRKRQKSIIGLSR